MYRSWSELRRSPFLLAARSRDGQLHLARAVFPGRGPSMCPPGVHL